MHTIVVIEDEPIEGVYAPMTRSQSQFKPKVPFDPQRTMYKENDNDKIIMPSIPETRLYVSF